MGGGTFNATTYLLDSHIDAGLGNAVAVRSRDCSLTYAELLDCVAHAAGGLRDLGVRPEERVLIVLLDGPDWLAAFLGTLRIGAVPVPVSTMLTSRDLIGIAQDARPRVAIVSDELASLPGFLAGTGWLDHIVVAGPPGTTAQAREHPRGRQIHRWQDFMQAAPAAAAATTTETPGFWLYTSGTTSFPHAAMHRQVDLRTTAEAFGSQVLGVRSDDIAYSVSKLFFAFGLGNSLTFPLSAGATAVLDRRPPTPTSVAEVIQKERPTLFFAVPSFYASLLAAEVPKDSFASVRAAVSAGESLPAEIFHRFRKRFGVEIIDGLGSTEALHTYLSNRPGQARAGTCGTPVPGYEVRIVNGEGRPVAPGKPGHLLLRGDSIATGYWADAAASRRVFEGEWLRTGDVCSCSPEGVFTHLGRANDMLKAGGIWVSPTEVEAALLQHPSLLEASVVGQPDHEGIERLVAYLVARPGQVPAEHELGAFVRERLAAFKRPRRFVLLPELPKTTTGKIRRTELRSYPWPGEQRADAVTCASASADQAV